MKRTPPIFKKILQSAHKNESFPQPSMAFFVSLLAVVLLYRIQLTIGLFTNPVRPFDFNPAHYPVWFMLAYWPYDFALVIIFFLLSWLVVRISYLTRQDRMSPIFKISEVISLHVILFILFLIHGGHGRLLFDVQTGLDASAIKEAFSGISFVEIIKLIEMRDYLFLLFPFVIFWTVFLSPLGLRVWIGRVSLILMIFLSFPSIFASNDKTKNIPAEIRLNPVLFLLSDVTENAFIGPSIEGRNINMIRESRPGNPLSRSVENNSAGSTKFLPAKRSHPWNIIFFVMESVGTRYIFNTDDGNPMPMPFLHKISKEGWFLKKHHTTSNVSTKAIFSIFSGAYDFFNRETFGIRAEAGVPAIYNWLGEDYDRFLVTPSSISWYFPTKFIKNNGMQEIHSYENLKFKIKEEFHSLGRYIARDEIQTADFFIQRVSKAREPFLGIYISFAAHFPYFDYGENYRIMKEDGRLINRYYNNLNLLDHMIKRIVDRLKEQGLLERTILVIVGDHGQAFGQHHPNNFMHYRYSYNENLETPAIFYQPALFKPKTLEFPTSHVDILPTLLDALRIPYPPMAFNGESLFNYTLRQTPIFFYGYEESVSSLDPHLIKVQYSLKKNICWAFDLKHDPDENNPLDCSRYSLQREVLHKFVSDHDERLLKYYTSLKEKKGISGVRVPIVKD